LPDHGPFPNLPVIYSPKDEDAYRHRFELPGLNVEILLIHSPRLAEFFSSGEAALLKGLGGMPLVVATVLCREFLRRSAWLRIPGNPPFDVRAAREKAKAILVRLERLFRSVSGPSRTPLLNAWALLRQFQEDLGEMPTKRARKADYARIREKTWPFHVLAFSYALFKLLSENHPDLKGPSRHRLIYRRLAKFRQHYMMAKTTETATQKQIVRLKANPQKVGAIEGLIARLLAAQWAIWDDPWDEAEARGLLASVRATMGANRPLPDPK
jgi:hypothetical protein